MKSVVNIISVILASMILVAAPARGAASFQGLGDFVGGAFASSASGISSDGSVVVGYGTTSTGAKAFRWTAATGMVSLGNLPDGSFMSSGANDVSADGTTVVGYGDPGGGFYTYKAFRWTQGTGMVSIGSLNGSVRSEAVGVSADGSVIVGDGGQQAFRWTQSGGMVGLGYLAGFPYSRAIAVSADCLVAACSAYTSGWTSEQSFRWTQAGGIVSLGNFSGGGTNFVMNISPDGTVIVGTGRDSTGYPAYRWTQSTGMVRLGHLAGKTNTYPCGVTINGTVIVGASLVGQSGSRAFIWDSGHGIRDLKGVLQSEYGVDLTGWTLMGAYDITPDGSTIVGEGINPSGQTEAWRAEVPTDTNAPTPNPMTWAMAPYGLDSRSISMTATTATDEHGVQYYFTCTSGGGHDSGWQNGTTYVDSGLAEGATYSYTVKARDNSLAGNVTSPSAPYAYATTLLDTTAPSPDPMTWSVAPHGAGLYSISMTATTATDASGVEYFFTCTSGSGHDSGWQDSTTYVNSGLVEGSTCTYTVKARDKSAAGNMTAESTPASASSGLDTTPPIPAKMSFAVAPAATGTGTITMTAIMAYDLLGVEYYFANMTDASHDSGWQDGTAYTDTGLVNNTTYTYKVIARDKSISHNENAWSEPNSATTPRYLCTGPITSDLSTDCQVDFLDFALMANQWSEVLPLTVDTMTNGTFDTDIVPGWQTIALPGATGYFVASFDGTTGNPPGDAIVASDADPDGTSGQWFYQVIPVIAGKQYKLSGEWMGDLNGSVAADPCNLGNRAEVMVAFESSADANTWTSWSEPNTVMYRKAFGSVTENIGPSGTWDWEQITASSTNGPADGVFTATGSYMVVAFNLGGLPASGVSFYYLDNLAVLRSPCPSADFDGNCFLDMKDFAAFAGQWLACNRNPADECGL